MTAEISALGSDLDRLVRDRPLITRELHASNAWYGHADLLKRFAGMPRRRSLKVTIEHGPSLDDYVWGVDAASPMPFHLCAAPWRAQGFSRETGIETIPIGPLIRYALPEIPPPPEEPLAIAFPAHSTHHVDTDYSLETFLAHLEEMRERSRVLVCIYWRDALRGFAKEFEARGFECITAGHMYDPEFLGRLTRILSASSRIFTNDIGTHVFYATLIDRPVQILSQEIDFVPTSDLADHVDPDPWDPRLLRCRELFASEVDRVTDAQRTFVEEFVGAESVLSQEEMRSLLETAERLYAELDLSRRLRLAGARERTWLRARVGPAS